MMTSSATGPGPERGPEPERGPKPGPERGRLCARLTGLRRALGLGWQAAPGLVVRMALCSVATAVLPVAAAWLTKLSLELVTRPGGSFRQLLAVGAGLVVVGFATALVPLATRYLG